MNIDRIKEIMKDKGICAKDIVDAAGLPKATVSEILNGVSSNPRIETVKKIACALGVTIDEIV